MLEVAHEMAKGLHKTDLIDAITMQKFDDLCENISSKKVRSKRGVVGEINA